MPGGWAASRQTARCPSATSRSATTSAGSPSAQYSLSNDALASAIGGVTGYVAPPARNTSTTGAKARTPSSAFGRSWTWTWSQPRSK
jgi:hypothetical protein